MGLWIFVIFMGRWIIYDLAYRPARNVKLSQGVASVQMRDYDD